jgi:hypothetical protein
MMGLLMDIIKHQKLHMTTNPYVNAETCAKLKKRIVDTEKHCRDLEKWRIETNYFCNYVADEGYCISNGFRHQVDKYAVNIEKHHRYMDSLEDFVQDCRPFNGPISHHSMYTGSE